MDKKDFKILEEKFLYKGFLTVKKYLLQHQLYKGGWSEVLPREILVRPLAVGVLPYDPVLDQVVLVEQFRVGALNDSSSPWLLEIVAGLTEEGEAPLDVAAREVHEEAGLNIEKLKFISKYWASPGGSSEEVVLYCAKVDAKNAGGIHGLVEEHEDIKVMVMPSLEAFAAVRSGKINNASTIIALQWLELNKNKLQAEW